MNPQQLQRAEDDVTRARQIADQSVEYYTEMLDQFIHDAAPLVGARHDRTERIAVLVNLLLQKERIPGNEGMCSAMLAIALTR